MKHIIYKGIKIYSGDSIMGSIEEITNIEGKLSINSNDMDINGLARRAYFCQNIKSGSSPNDQKKYKYG